MLSKLTRLRADSWLGALMRWPLKLIPRRHVAKVRGGINKGRRWIVGSSIHGCWLGTYEEDKQSFVKQVVRPGMVVWDVGANAGFYSLAFSRLVGETGKVFAFEPLAENANNLLAHISLNQVRNVSVVQAALAERSGVIGFSVADSNSMGKLSQREHAYLVPTLSADEFLERFPESRPDLLKIDIEGAEAWLLAGASRLLKEVGPQILLALHGEDPTRECMLQLRAHGYGVFYLDGAPVGSPPLRSDEVFASRLDRVAPPG
jgi:FkbM family methyltransferase